MIVYRHQTEMEPPEIAGRLARPGTHAALCHQSDQGYFYAGIVEPAYWEIPLLADWFPIAGGWWAAKHGEAPWSPDMDISRMSCWARSLPVEDAKGRKWLAPVIRLPGDGGRAYPVAYAGADFLPSPTPEQATADAIADEARSALIAGSSGRGIPVRVACQWTARLLSLTHHVSPETLAVLGLIDSELVQRVLMVAAGLDARLDPHAG